MSLFTQKVTWKRLVKISEPIIRTKTKTTALDLEPISILNVKLLILFPGELRSIGNRTKLKIKSMSKFRVDANTIKAESSSSVHRV